MKHFTFTSIWAPASFAEAFSPPGDSAEQNKSRGAAPAVSRGLWQLFGNPLAHRQPRPPWATSTLPPLKQGLDTASRGTHTGPWPRGIPGLPGFCFTWSRLGGTWAGGRGIPLLIFCNRTTSEISEQKTPETGQSWCA